jgi:hypothetical protein
MLRKALLGLMMVFPVGCTQTHRYDVDLRTLRDIDWNGKVAFVDRYYGFFEGWRTERVEFESKDGSVLTVTPQNGDIGFTLESDVDGNPQELIRVKRNGMWANLFACHDEFRPVECKTRAKPVTAIRPAD